MHTADFYFRMVLMGRMMFEDSLSSVLEKMNVLTSKYRDVCTKSWTLNP